MKRIALVEDNPDNRLLVQAILDGAFEVEEYESGSDALSGMQANPPQLVLLDISLPGMDGTEVLRRLRANGRLSALPVIALTAHAMSGDREKFLALGFDAYVTKPIVDESVLLGEIERLLQREG
jgi:two-component system, cell cycle response regulator DivK